MKFAKRNRLVNEMLLADIRKKSCVVCHKKPVHVHHLTTRGAGGNDELNNLVPVCFFHHAEIHSIGNVYMAAKYLNFQHWLITNKRTDLLEVGYDS